MIERLADTTIRLAEEIGIHSSVFQFRRRPLLIRVPAGWQPMRGELELLNDATVRVQPFASKRTRISGSASEPLSIWDHLREDD